MKLTKETLKQIIKEEVQAVLNEAEKKKHRVVFTNGVAKRKDIVAATNYVAEKLKSMGDFTPRDRKTVMNAIEGQKKTVKLQDFALETVGLSQYLEYVN
jgi:methionine synthase II (cobalamin-independent)